MGMFHGGICGQPIEVEKGHLSFPHHAEQREKVHNDERTCYEE